MKSKKLWIILITIVALLGAGFIFRNEIFGMINSQAASAARAENGPVGAIETTLIRSAADSARVSAAGNIAVTDELPAVFRVGGTIVGVAVEVGDQVLAGDLLVTLDTVDLERAVTQAELNLASAQANLDKLLETADPADLASAQANLASAQENLLDVQAGPSASEIAAAEANLAAAQERYQDLLAGPSESELIQLQASLEKAQISLQQAQWDYDKIAYSDSVGSSPQAASLQQATIDYESAKAAYEQAVEPTSQAELQDALSNIQNAQNQLDTLREQPTPASIASAEAQVASAAAQLEQLLTGSSEAERRAAEISVEQAQLDLDEAWGNLAKAQLTAPIDGTILAVDAKLGQQVTTGFSAASLANLNELELTVNVAEVDVSKLMSGQRAIVTIDALPNRAFEGVVSRITPASSSDQGVVNYPVTIQLTDDDLSGVRPGMTAVATILDQDQEIGWLVPTAAIRDRNGQSVVMILREGQPVPISVTVDGSQGEWTVVQSPELQEGDEAVGAVSSFLNQGDQQSGGFGPPGGGPGRAFGGGR